MIAGCFWPVQLMPAFLQRLAQFFPQWRVLDAVQKLQEEGGMSAIASNLLVIMGYALVLFLVAGYRFSRTREAGVFV